MVPGAIVRMEKIPILPNGKLDRKALPKPEQSVREEEYVGPRTAEEEILAGIFAEVLGVERVGVHDNFFALGGDSILSIQIGFRSRKVGLHFTVQQLFRHQTIAELAAVATTSRPVQDEPDASVGELPLTPIQHFFFEQNLTEPHHHNQSILLDIRQKTNPSLLEKAFRHLFEHHDGLRSRYETTASGCRQEIVPYDGAIPFSLVDVSHLSESEASFVIEATVARRQTGLNLSSGPLMLVTFFQCGDQKPDCLSIICHHLVVDGVSWRILLEDLELACRQLISKATVQLAPKTTSFRSWAQKLSDYARSPELQKEMDYWLDLSCSNRGSLPLDFNGGVNIESSSQAVSVSLSTNETRCLLNDVQRVYRAQINEILLTALAQALSGWVGSRSLTIDLEGHGREHIIANVDLSRTVGWFTSMFPVTLDLGAETDPIQKLEAVKEELRRIPNRGIGYGALRYLKTDREDKMRRHFDRPQLLFNYFGQLDLVLPNSSLFSLARESTGPSRSPSGNRSHLLVVEGSVINGQLRFNWTYCKDIHKRTTIERLAHDFLKALRTLIERSQTSATMGYTPSDFPKARINQGELDELLARMNASLGDER
jgi:non-ribosomal peptide synthase protein (TIGR01720 family)